MQQTTRLAIYILVALGSSAVQGGRAFAQAPELRSFDTTLRHISGVIFASGGDWVICSGDKGRIVVLDSGSGATLGTADDYEHQAEIKTLSVTSDSKLLITAAFMGRVQVWKLPALEHVQALPSGAKAALLTRDSYDLLVLDRSLLIWDLRTQSEKKRLDLNFSALTCASASKEHIVGLWPEPRGLATTEAGIFSVSKQAWEMKDVAKDMAGAQIASFTPDGKWLVAGFDADGNDNGIASMEIWDVASRKRTSVLELTDTEDLLQIEFTPNSRYLACCASIKDQQDQGDHGKTCVRLIDLKEQVVLPRKRFAPLSAEKQTWPIAVGNSRIATTGESSTVRLWDAGTIFVAK